MNKTNVKINIYLHTYIFIKLSNKVSGEPHATRPFSLSELRCHQKRCEVSKTKKQQAGSEKERMSAESFYQLPWRTLNNVLFVNLA